MGAFRFVITLIVLNLFSSCYTSSKMDKAIDKKSVLAVYSGGGKFDTRLVLFKDSTFIYASFPDFFPSITKAQKGHFTFTKDSNYITLRSFMSRTSFRVKGDSILMYSEADERSKHAKFIMDYYTLRRD